MNPERIKSNGAGLNVETGTRAVQAGTQGSPVTWSGCVHVVVLVRFSRDYQRFFLFFAF